MSGKFILDDVVKELSEAFQVFIPCIVFGELCYGARKSGRVDSNLLKLDELLLSSAVLDCGAETGRQYAIVKNYLRLKGKPIPENDIWIAALALQHEAVLVTRDAHFQQIANLTVENW